MALISTVVVPCEFDDAPISPSHVDREVLYRIEGSAHEDGGVYLSGFEFPVTGKTPKGVRIDVWGQSKFVLGGGGKRFAYPNKEAALSSFKLRKKRQVEILRSQLKRAEMVLAAVNSGKEVCW